MIVSMIVAVDEGSGIGYRGALPWHLPVDIRRFKHLTTGHHIIMGRKTYESIGIALPGRVSLVISHKPIPLPEGCYRMDSLESALSFAKQQGEDEAFVIGGGEIFTQSLDYADRIYLTLVHATFPKDVLFPGLDPGKWVEVSREESFRNEKDLYNSTFIILEKDLHSP